MIKVFVHVDTMTIVSSIMLSWTYFVFPGSCRRNVSKTLISILLASLYFWTALMTLMATLRLLSTFLASTTLPKVPWPRRRTILSISSASLLEYSRGHTLVTDDIVWFYYVVTFCIVPCIRLVGGDRLDLWTFCHFLSIRCSLGLFISLITTKV
jgi:hypothetical protein